MHFSVNSLRRAAIVLFFAFLTAGGPARAFPADTPGETEPRNRLTSDEIAAGWINLFDGRTMFG